MIEELVGPAGERLATVLRLGGPLEGLHFLSRPEDLLQVGVMFHRTGHRVSPHQHNPVVRVTEGTAEVLVVLSGMVRVDVYKVGPDGEPTGKVKRCRLGRMDAVVFHPGSVHALEVTFDARVIEVKTGPYTTRADDKTDGTEEDDGQKTTDEETSDGTGPPQAAAEGACGVPCAQPGTPEHHDGHG